MKALTKCYSQPGIWMTHDAQVPECGPNDVLINIHKTAICGTDLHIYLWDDWAQNTIPVPMIVGHEFVGEIVQLGSQVTGLSIGQRVSGEGHITCGMCRNCRAGVKHLCQNTQGIGVNRTGAFAEYLAMPASNVFVISDNIHSDIASIFDPFGNAVHATLTYDLVGEDILITGAGPIGIMSVAIARHVGARRIVVTDINPYRLQMAQKMGADVVLDVSDCSDETGQQAKLRQAMSDLNMKEGFDIGLEMSGVPDAINSMVHMMKNAGKMALMGISKGSVALDWNAVVFKGLQIKGIYGRQMYETWYKMASMVDSGLDVSSVITHHFPIDEFEKGFQLMRSGQCGKVILDWTV